MKKLLKFALGFVLALTFGQGIAMAGQSNNLLHGPYWQFNIIGLSYDTDVESGDHGSGRVIMVPLDNKRNKNDGVDLLCPADTDVRFVDDDGPNYSMGAAGGARIYFEISDHFEIIDKDALDNNGARILIPSTLKYNPLHDAGLCSECSELKGTLKNFCVEKYCIESQDIIEVDVWVRVLGKPNKCLNLNLFAYDDYQELYFWSGRIELTRKVGKTTWEPVDKIFEVHWCTVESDECVEGTAVERSVFHDVFRGYFWDAIHDDTRLVQVRLYPVTP